MSDDSPVQSGSLAPPAALHSANSCVNRGSAVMDQSGLLGKHQRISSIYSYFNISNTKISASGFISSN